MGSHSIVTQFVRNALPKEHLIGLLDLYLLNAKHITTQLLSYLQNGGYNIDNIVSQHYDEAAVMKGVSCGV